MSRSTAVRSPRVPALSREDYRLLVESFVDYAIVMLDADGKVATWNIGAEKIKGYPAAEIIGQHFSKFYLPEDIAAREPERELEIATTEGRVEGEGFRVRKDGTRFWASAVMTALRDEEGGLRGFGVVTRDLTKRHAAEEELRRAEQRFHHLVDAVVDYAIYMLDAQGRVSTWNSGACRLKGYSAEEIIGRHFSVFYTDEDRAANRPGRILDLVRRDGRYEEEDWRVRKDGTRFWASVVLTALRDEQGELIGFAKVTRDLSARRAREEAEHKLLRERVAREIAEDAERKLRESEERYRELSKHLDAVLEGVADGITAQDTSGRLVFANTAAARLCGFESREELLKAPVRTIMERFETFDEQGQPFKPENLPGRRALEGEHEPSAIIHVRERAGGKDWWTLVRASPILSDGNKPAFAINIWHDVTSLRRGDEQAKRLSDATAALAASLDHDEMLETLARALVPGFADWCAIQLLENASLRNVAVAHVDPEKVAMAREHQQRFPPDLTRPTGVAKVLKTGVSQLYNDVTDELLTESIQDPERLASLRSIGMKALLLAPIRFRERVLGVISLISAESNRRYDASDVALLEELGARAGAALDNARLYRAAQDAARRAEEASRVKDDFLATVSHELRTPLNAIVGWSSLLSGRVTDPAIAKPLAVIQRNAYAQAQIIDDILDVSRVVTGNFRIDAQPCDLIRIARDALEVVRPSAVAKKLSLVFSPGEDFLLLIADGERLQQVVWNLLSNAVKFTPSGGSVTLAVRQQDSSAVLSVSDTGKGIEDEFLPHVFERFKQADSSITRRVGGLGLGLALVRHIVELHGGEVAVHSPGAGLGSTFTITLPIRALVTGRGSAPPPAATANASLAGVRVLVVDDEPDARDLIATVLGELGAIVNTAPSAAAGMDALRDFRANVLISDIGMPDEDGYSFIRRVRALPATEGGTIPALALTAFARDEDERRALNAGYNSYLKKPVELKALAAAIGALIAH